MVARKIHQQSDPGRASGEMNVAKCKTLSPSFSASRGFTVTFPVPMSPFTVNLAENIVRYLSYVAATCPTKEKTQGYSTLSDRIYSIVKPHTRLNELRVT